MRTVEWDYDRNLVKMIDQRQLPSVFEIAEFTDYHDVAMSIREMYIRGAPAIGAAAAFGMALAVQQSQASNRESLLGDLETAAEVLRATRPTAVNLFWGIKRVLDAATREDLEHVDDIRQAILDEAQKLADEDVEINQRMARNGAALVKEGDTVSWREGSTRTEYYKQVVAEIKSKDVPGWLELDRDNLVGQVVATPTPEDAGAKFEGQSIVEYYSR